MKLEEEEKLYGNNYQLRYEELKKELEHLQKENEGLRKLADHLENLISFKYISKDKIKEKIELLELETTITVVGMRSSGKTASILKKIGKLEALEDLLKEE